MEVDQIEQIRELDISNVEQDATCSGGFIIETTQVKGKLHILIDLSDV